MRTDGRTDRHMTQLIFAFNNLVNTPKIEAWIEKQRKWTKLRQCLRLVMTPLKRSLIWKPSAINFPHLTTQKTTQAKTVTRRAREMTAGLGHSHRREFSLKRSFVPHVDNGTVIYEIYYDKKFSLKRRVCLGLYIYPVTWLRASRPMNRGSILGMGK